MTVQRLPRTISDILLSPRAKIATSPAPHRHESRGRQTSSRISAWLLASSFALGIGAFAAPGAKADENVAEFYKDKVVRLQVGAEAGSSFDLSARLLARHIGNHIPGTPAVVVQNVPGAGSLTLTNQIYSGTPTDGTVFGAIINGIPTAPLLRPQNARFDVTKLNWIGNINRETHVLIVWHTAQVKSLDDLATKQLIVGATTLGTANTDFPLLLRDVLGYRFKIVAGYKNSASLALAMARGEVEGNAGTGWTTVNMQNYNDLKTGNIKVIGQFGLKKHSDLPDVPLVIDRAKTEADQQALRLAFIRGEFGRSFIAPPGVPPVRIEALRRAFDATMRDPAFLAEAEKTRLEVDPATGEELTALIQQIAATPPDIVSRVRNAFNPSALD